MAKPKILLIDANALVHRAFHALPPLTTKKGELVNAVYGFSLILLKAIADIKPKYIAIAFDYPKPTFRHKEYKEYKATRQKAPQELIEQFPKIKEVVSALSFPVFELEGFEADDLVGTLAVQAKKEGLEAIIVTGDSDEIQLVEKDVLVYTMRRGFTDTVTYNEKMVEQKYEGLKPHQLIDLKALEGDSSDNIKGITGVGEKTALSLVKNYGSVEKLITEIKNESEKIQEIKPKVLETLKDSEKKLLQNKYLVTIIKDVPVKLNLEKSDIENYDRNAVIEIFTKYGFKTLLPKLPKSIMHESKKGEIDFEYEILKEKDALAKILSGLSKKGKVVMDTETETLDSISGKLLGVSLSSNGENGFYIPIDKKISPFYPELKKFLENPKIKKIGHNLKYDINVLKNNDITVKGIFFDTMIAYYLLHPGDRKFNLDDLAFSELSYEKIPIESLIGKKGKGQKLMSEVPTEDIGKYSVEDAVITWRLFEKSEKLMARERLTSLFSEIEMPTAVVLAEIERNGVKIDTSLLVKISEKLETKIGKLKKRICSYSENEININSPIQLKELLFEKLKLAENPEIKKQMKKVKSGGYSTDAKALEKLKNLHPIIKLILEYRELSKLKTTYADALPKLINKNTKRLHTSFNQTITATGRLSSSDPNLQNIPIKTELGREIRRAFVAEKGKKLISADYSQIELRIIAHLSGDKTMIKSFRDNEDIHTRTAAEVNEVPLDKVTYKMRQAAKATNFGIVYGIGAHGLSEQLGWERQEAQNYIDKYHRKHPSLIKYLEKTIKDTRKKGYAETIFGRRRFIPEINSSNFQVRASGERMAINFPAQGSAADLIKKAMIDIDKELKQKSPQAKMILQVHDELVFEVDENEVTNVAKIIKGKMEGVYPKLDVPIKVDISYGNNWGQMDEIN